ncbi:extracellular solute-binding protein [Varunaivibrio sulfuroxidans]|uniref:Microcin C transport system substrate-binding protein n=1 Tax=Varunaivibrio sulfuroxidans TaxID=1773489 RepID=A0A4R3JGL2_9PROT|nr:extracellular solute-binding protein [Varunaivibrio sulfuroxidans]TCS65037.1 microcin C transport system substrate-binding protein [Varunaivibrio sulfuroxidans]WES29674.1 extracellular solute-binding protein [Varunaivibrio sulfuroxidans]
MPLRSRLSFPTRVAVMTAVLMCAAWAFSRVGFAGGTQSPSAAKVSATVAPRHALAMFGAPKYPAGFAHFDYADPKAVKGGSVRLAAIGTFDNLNPFILNGVAAAGAGLPFETLTVSSEDEPFSVYGLLAESMQVPKDRSWVAFTLRKEARWQDGAPVTTDDVIFSLNILRTKGHPFYRSYFARIDKAVKIGPRTVKFIFKPGSNRELPLIAGQLPILPKHYWQGRDFSKTTLEAPLGSGPYRVASVDPGRSVTYARVKNYWGAKLGVNVGQNNFGAMRYDYYRDATVALEAFKAGDYDFRQENISKNWATAYTGPAVAKGLIRRASIANEQPTGMQGYVFNIRRPLFKDRRVREALTYAFDFEWTNKNLFYGQYTRTESYFSNSELASSGLPKGRELAILERYRGKIPDAVFTRPFHAPRSDGTGFNRKNLRIAAKLLQQAGWSVKNGVLTNEKTNQPFRFEILISQPAWERITLPFIKNLKVLGIDARLRVVDSAQYIKRSESFDYDMIVDVFGESLSPGNEQRDFWGSQSADRRGGRNTIGIKNPVIDDLVNLVVSAKTRRQLLDRTHALDRVLLWEYYVIPHWHSQAFHVAYWNKFSRPKVSPKYGLCFSCWWVDPQKAAHLKALKKAL